MKPTSIREQDESRGFTVIELLVVIAVIALLAAVRVPALCRVNVKSQAFVCMSNQRQLTAAWTGWSLDHGDNLLDSRAWVNGDVSNPGNPDFVDFYKYLPAGPLTPYVGGNVLKGNKCPADTRVSTIPGASGPVCRSLSMNNYIGTSWTTGFLVYYKTSDLRRPGPANTYVFLDESGMTIDDGNFLVDMVSYDALDWPGKWFVVAPGAYHDMAGSFSFADGHCEIHKWNDPRTRLVNYFVTSPNNVDIDWLQSKSSAKITNPTR